jgi:hypothetical protein
VCGPSARSAGGEEEEGSAEADAGDGAGDGGAAADEVPGATGASPGAAGAGALEVGGSVGALRTQATARTVAKMRTAIAVAGAQLPADGTRGAGELGARGKTKFRLEIAAGTRRALILRHGASPDGASFRDE